MKKIKIKAKTLLASLVALALVAVAGYFIFVHETPSGFATSCVDAMKAAKTKYESNKGSTSAADAVQDIQQAIFEGDQYYEELKQTADEQTVKDFELIFIPVRNELQDIVDSEE